MKIYDGQNRLAVYAVEQSKENLRKIIFGPTFGNSRIKTEYNFLYAIVVADTKIEIWNFFWLDGLKYGQYCYNGYNNIQDAEKELEHLVESLLEDKDTIIIWNGFEIRIPQSKTFTLADYGYCVY